MHKHNSARAAFRTSIIRWKMLGLAFHNLIINLAAKVLLFLESRKSYNT